MAASTSSTSKLFASCTCAVRRSAFRIQRSQIHTRPNLPYEIEQGVQPFLSAQALRGTAIDWHQGNLGKLNDLVRGTKYENSSVAQTVINSAKEKNDALIFGYASEALNNGYFLSCLTPTPGGEKALESTPIEIALSNNFGSPTSFINHFSSYAMGMFGTGYVWLVMDGVDNLAVVGTYGSGTVLVQGSVQRAKEIELDELASLSESESSSDSNAGTATSPSSSLLGQTRSYHSSAVRKFDFPEKVGQTLNPRPFQNLVGPEGMGSSSNATAPARSSDLERFQSIHPLLCLSLHPHVYIPDYGIWGKEEYIRNFWGNVDWQLAYKRYQAVRELKKQQQPVGHLYGGRQ